jgi:hypothetical protein
MEEAIKLSRFLKRLMTFFHPFSHRFSDIERTTVSTSKYLSYRFQTIHWQVNLRWVKLGCTLLTTLLTSLDGRHFLATEDEFLKQLRMTLPNLTQ